MTTKVSTGLRNSLLDGDAFRYTMEGCFMDIYGGAPPPNSADDAIPGGATLLCTISDDAGVDGLDFEATASNGMIAKDSGQIWRGVNVADGVATFFRLRTASDDNTSSTVFPRVQGACGLAGVELNMSNTTLVTSESKVIDSYVFAIPTN